MWLRRVVGLCSSASRGWIAALTVARIVSRLLLLVTATVVASGDAKLATATGLVAAGAMALQRVLHAGARAAVERDMYRATARAFLEADALEIEEANPTREFMDGLFHAGRFLYDTSPALVGDVVVLSVVGPWIALVSPPRFVAIVGVASSAIALAALAGLRRTRRVETEMVAALRGVQEELFSAVDGRLEIIAAGRDRAFSVRFDETLARYQRRVQRLGLASALLGRAPIAAALAVIAVIVALDADSLDVLTRTFLSQALVLAACVPSTLGVVQGIHAVTRARSQLVPFARLFEQPRRREEGREVVTLPAPFVADRVSFAYAPGGTWVLADLDVRWEKGVLAAIGANGSGKSTLLKLLLGLRSPQRGTLTNGGVEVSALDLPAWRAQVAYLPQRPYLGEPYVSIRGSFRLAQPDASDEAILAELDAVGLRAMLHGRADLLGTRVGELSAGQRQRLGFARILLQDAKLVILDEPDANLDAAGIQLVADAIRKLRSEGKMIAVAAHTEALTAVADVVVNLAERG